MKITNISSSTMSQILTRINKNQVIISIALFLLIFSSIGNISDIVEEAINIQAYAQTADETTPTIVPKSSLPDNTLLRYRNDSRCASNIIKGYNEAITARHCVVNLPYDSKDANSLDSPVDKVTKKAVSLGTPRLGRATLVVFHFGKVKLIPVNVTKVYGCSSNIKTVGKGYFQQGDSGGALYQEDAAGNKIAVGVISRYSVTDSSINKTYEENRKASNEGDTVYRDCRVASNRRAN
jgi:hypothetical protein